MQKPALPEAAWVALIYRSGVRGGGPIKELSNWCTREYPKSKGVLPLPTQAR